MSRTLTASVALLLLFAALPGCKHAVADSDGEKKEADVRVRVEPAAERELAEKVTGLGRCEAVPEHFAVLTAAAEGRVIGLLKRPGEEVKPGDAIVQLDSTVAERNLIEKQRALESQKLAIDQADVALEESPSHHRAPQGAPQAGRHLRVCHVRDRSGGTPGRSPIAVRQGAAQNGRSGGGHCRGTARAVDYPHADCRCIERTVLPTGADPFRGRRGRRSRRRGTA